MIQSVDRAVRVLGVLQGARRMTPGEIAGELGLPPSTVHGLLTTLLAHGMVTQERSAGRYRLGPTVLRLGNVYLETLELRSRVHGWAADLARGTGFAVRTAVLSLGEVVVVHHEPRPDGSRQMAETGIVIPAHASALGKAVLAYDPVATDALLRGPDGDVDALATMTGDTITDPRHFRRRLERTRRTGVADEVEEAVLGECGVAAPVFDASGEVAGAIGIVVPASEWPVDGATVNAVRAAARGVSRQLGATSWPVVGG